MKDNEGKKISRRDFLKYVGMGSATLSLSLSSLNSFEAFGQNQVVLRQATPQGDFGPLDPQLATTGYANKANFPVFNGLVRMPLGEVTISPDGVEPDLCKDWEVSSSKREYTFHLREGVKWHHGYGEFTAEDVKFTFDRIRDPSLGSPWGNRYEGWDVEEVDDYTVKITVPEYDPTLFAKLINYQGGLIACKDAVDDMGRDQYNFAPVGTGPYYIETHKRGDRIVHKPFDEHFRWESGEVERTNIDRFDSIVTGGTEGLFSGAWSGRYHLVNVTADYRMVNKQVKAHDLELMKFGAPLWSEWYPNTQMPPFDQLKVRQAVAHAINPKEVAAFFDEGTGVAYPSNAAWEAKGVRQDDYPDMPISGFRGGLDLKESVYPYNPEKARKLLAEAGYPDGFDAGELIVLQGGTMEPPPKVIQQQLKKVGIEFNISLRDWVGFIEAQRQGRNPMSYYHCSRFPDSWFYLKEFLQSDAPNNFAQWSNDKFDSLLAKSAKERDLEKRTEMLQEAQMIALEEAVVIPLYRWFMPAIRNPHVDLGYEPKPGGLVDGPFVTETTRWKE